MAELERTLTVDDLRRQLQGILEQRARLDEGILHIQRLIDDQAPAAPAPLPAPSSGTSVAVPAVHADVAGLPRMTSEELDRLPYGVITVDGRGRVLHYNEAESRMVGLPAHQVVGRCFFTEIAPCTQVQAFRGRFERFVEGGQGLNVESFDFVFPFPAAPQEVTILLTPARRRGQYQIAILRRAGAASVDLSRRR